MRTDTHPTSPGWETALSWGPPQNPPPSGGPKSTTTRSKDEQGRITRSYDRTAWLNDAYDPPGIRRRRHRLLSNATGRVLEAGVGSGHNLAYYPAEVSLVGFDVSAAMLKRARRRADEIGRVITLERADVTALPYLDDCFDTTVATSVFCSVPDPIAGLRELARVTKPDGQILLLEHVRPSNPLLGWLADVATPITRRLFGFRLNRRTEDNIAAAGLDVVGMRREGTWREIIALPDRRLGKREGTQPWNR